MTFLSYYRCIDCGKTFVADAVHYLCDECASDYRPGIPLPGVLEAVFDYAAIAYAWQDNPDIRLFSAVDPVYFPDLPVGDTPFFRSERLASHLQCPNLWIKFDGLNPSGSLKDRASMMIVAEARRLGIKQIVTASTGNAACSLAALCANAGIQAVIFAPAQAPPAKLIQILVHGAELHKVEGTYDYAYAAALDYAAHHECLIRNTGYHPLTIEGKKSAGLEIYVQHGKVPDWIVIPVGDGVILSAIHKAFLDLKRTGIIDRLPRLLAVQAESSDAIFNYWKTGVYRDAAQPRTVADSISVRTPSCAHWSIQALQETQGDAVLVTDSEILPAQKELAAYAGVFAEPSSSSTLAGLRKALTQGIVKQDDSVVLLVTGHGLKDPGAVKLG